LGDLHYYKVEQNIKKINELIKAINPKTGLAIKPMPNATREAQRVKEAETKNQAFDRYQQGIGQAKVEAPMGPQISDAINNVPAPKTETVPLTSGNAFAQKQADIAAAAEARKAAKLKFL